MRGCTDKLTLLVHRGEISGTRIGTGKPTPSFQGGIASPTMNNIHPPKNAADTRFISTTMDARRLWADLQNRQRLDSMTP